MKDISECYKVRTLIAAAAGHLGGMSKDGEAREVKLVPA